MVGVRFYCILLKLGGVGSDGVVDILLMVGSRGLRIFFFRGGIEFEGGGLFCFLVELLWGCRW